MHSYCNNCGKSGHLFYQCKQPITSIGIICLKYHEITIKYLMIRRKNSLGYVDFLRGKYPLYNVNYITNIINEMTIKEKNNLLTQDFDTLWHNLWGQHIGIQHRGEERISREKMTAIRSGIAIHDKQITFTLESLIKASNTSWDEPEWGFPKGRRNYCETDMQCALREFEEETGYNHTNIKIILNIVPFDEIFTGSNYKSYKHRYFIAHIDDNGDDDKNIESFQKSEVSKMEWMTFEEANDNIRPYNFEKKQILKNVNNLMMNHTICALF